MKYVALLRGINVGGNNQVEMPRLKTLFEKMGFKDVATYINSGNVVFSSPTPPDAENIEKAIEAEFGFRPKTLIRSAQNIKMVCSAIPEAWENNTDQKTDVLFLWDEVDSPDVVRLIEQNPAVESLIYCQGAVIWNVSRKNYPKSKMGDFIKNPIYKKMTARNCNTVRKLQNLLIS